MMDDVPTFPTTPPSPSPSTASPPIQPQHYPFLVQDEDAKLISLLYNYFSLGQFELGRATLQQLYNNNPSKVDTILNNILVVYGFPCNWLSSSSIPSAAHFAWLCAIEYTNLQQQHANEWPKLPVSLLRSIEFAILLHDSLGDSGDDNMVIEAALNELCTYQQLVGVHQPDAATLAVKNVAISDFSLAQLSKIFILFPLLGRIIFKYLEATPMPQTLSQIPPIQPQQHLSSTTLWSLHNLYTQIVVDILGKQQYDEIYGYLQVLYPSSLLAEAGSELGETASKHIRTLMRKIIELCFASKQQTSSDAGSGDLNSANVARGLHWLRSIPKGSTSMDMDRVYEGFLQCHNISALHSFCKELQLFLKEKTNDTGLPTPFLTISGQAPLTQPLSNDIQHEFWYWYFHYISVNNVHFLEYTTNRVMSLVSSHQFNEANIMLTAFERLRALVFLMSWDNFEDDVVAKCTLARVLWETRNSASGDSSFPLASKADQIAFQVKQAWWALTNLHPAVANWQALGTKDDEISQSILAALKTQSLAYVMRQILPDIQPADLIQIIQENPEITPSATFLKDQDSDVIRGYYAIKQIVSLLDLIAGKTTLVTQDKLNTSFSVTSQLLGAVKSASTKISLLEMLYISIFTTTNHLRNSHSATTTATNTNSSSEARLDLEFMRAVHHASVHPRLASPTQYLATSKIVGGLLQIITKCLDDYRANTPNADAHTLQKRVDRLSLLIREAHTRFTLVNSIPQSSSQDTNSTSFMAHMTAVPTTLLTYCMRGGNFTEQCEAIIQFFGLQDNPLSKEAKLAKQLDELCSIPSRAESEVMADFNKIVSGLPSDVAFTTHVDLATSCFSASLARALLTKAESVSSTLGSIFGTFISQLSCLSKHFPDSSLRSVLLNINQLKSIQRNPTSVLLESQLSNQLSAASHLVKLQNLVNESSKRKSVSGDQAETSESAVIGSMTKIFGGLLGDSYLHHFLEHALSLSRALERWGDYFSLVTQGPNQIVQELVFNHKSYKKAEELAKILKLDLPGIIFSTLLRNKAPQELQIELVEYLGIKLPSMATLACVLRCPEHAPKTLIENFMSTALKLAKDFPTLQTWVNTHSEAKKLFWKTCRQATDTGSLSAEDKAVFLSMSSAEDIPESLYAKIVEGLIACHTLPQAVEISDKYITGGAADWLLKVMAESPDEGAHSWLYVRRIKDKLVATGLVLKWYTSWSLDVCLDMLFMCKCHLNQQKQNFEHNMTKGSVIATKPSSPPGSPTLQMQHTQYLETVEHLYNQMQTFRSILAADSSWKDWQAIDELAKRDSVALIRQLLGIKQYVLARKIRDLFVVPNIKTEIDESYLLHLLEQNDTSTALKTLMELGEDSIKVVESLSDKIQENYSTKLFLVQFLMGNMSSALSSASYQALSTRETGIKVLLKLPKELQQQYAKLTDYPSLIIESLIMDEMAPQVHRLLSEIPSLRDDDMILKYASKALAFRTSESTGSSMAPIHSSQTLSHSGTTLTTSTSSETLAGTETTTNHVPPTTPAPIVPPSPSPSRRRRAKWHLSAPPDDAPVRAAHYFPAAPSISLAKALFDLVGDRRRAGQTCLSVCTGLAQRLSAVYSDENLLIISLIRQLLLYGKLQFMQDPRGGGSDGVATCDTFLGKVELFQELVIAKCTFNTSLEDLSDPQKARHLRDKLISSDRLKFAIDVATKCNILPDPAWLAWGLSLLAVGKYPEAREKFKYCLASATERRAASSTVTHPHSDMVDPTGVLIKILAVLESQPAPQPLYLRHLCDKLMTDPQNTKGGTYYDEMSVDAYLSAMHVGATKSPAGTPTKPPHGTPTKDKTGGASAQKQPLASIDSERYEEATYYIKKYGTARGLINFQMRHGKLGEAISTLVSENIPPNIFHEEMFLPCLARGNIGSLFEIAKRSNTSLAKLNPHLTHTCKMLFQARHYQLLQTVQVFMGDPVRAGLTSIKMYMDHVDVSDYDGKLKILEDAKRFFQEGLSTKSVVVQGAGAALPDADIAKYAQTTSIQIEVLSFLHSQGKLVPPATYKLSLFGPPSQKSEIAEQLLILYNFALAFRIMQDFRLPINTIYLNAICTMSRKKQVAKVNDLLKEIKGTCSDNDWDEIVLASIKVYVTELQDIKTAEKIAAKLVGSKCKVVAHILCGKRKAAYLQAVRDNDRELVLMVCKEAEKAHDATIFGLCEKYLSQNS